MALSKSTMLELSNIDGRVKTSGTSMEGDAENTSPIGSCSADVSGLVVSIQ